MPKYLLNYLTFDIIKNNKPTTPIPLENPLPLCIIDKSYSITFSSTDSDGSIDHYEVIYM
jgi:hypothetical protein